MKEVFKGKGLWLMEDRDPWASGGLRGQWGGRWGGYRELAKLDGDQDVWASSGLGAHRDACRKGFHPDGLLVIGTGPRCSGETGNIARGGSLLVSPEGMTGPLGSCCGVPGAAVGPWCVRLCQEHFEHFQILFFFFFF